jgi:hypothetical protein
MPRCPITPNVGWMSVDVPRPSNYLVEWYWTEISDGQLDETCAKLKDGAAQMCGEGSPVELLMTLAVPADEVMFAVFAARSAEAVSEACRRAGWPAERLTDALDARIPGKG